MGPSRSSPSPASLCTKTLACSSLAKANPSSSVPAAAQGRYRIPLTQHKGRWQPRRPSRKQDKHSDTPTAYRPPIHRTSHQMDACGVWIPVKSTWLKAVQADNFIGWPLLTSRSVQKYFPETVETPKGHLNQCRKNVRSTKPKPIPLETFQSPQLVGRKLRGVYTHVYDTRDTIFSDQTGQFPHRSSSGNHYLMVMVDIDFERYPRVVPSKHVLDNEISTAMKTLITDTYKMTYELVPPGCHRRNAAEVAIRNFKSHFLSILAGVAGDFPMKLWDKLLPQAEITINLLRQSNATPTVSAYAHLNGPFDYNKMPLAPMGCSVQVHEKSGARHMGIPLHRRLAVSACAAALKGITAPTKDIADLKALLDITASTSNIADCVPRVRTTSTTTSLPRVLPTPDTATHRVTRSMTNQPNPTSTTPVAIPALAPLPKPNAANSRSMQLSLTQLLLATLVHTPQPKPNSLPPQQQAPAQRVSHAFPNPFPSYPSA
eukprot:CCRYP_002921-RA/>CCRYP_002921-RA protein AED:0.32 eAED:0.32 QI:0/0/0/1/1/1/3/0/487